MSDMASDTSKGSNGQTVRVGQNRGERLGYGAGGHVLDKEETGGRLGLVVKAPRLQFSQLGFDELVDHEMDYRFADSEITGSYSLIKADDSGRPVYVLNAVPGSLCPIFAVRQKCQ